ncbi:hypothetical protein CSA37_02390 [Candidatus Fermentibacteria bacterium]|nr:MAG: hypothetical protein CSA37_02390 [Candidatus Fermentibacteria bacterium]
MLITELEVRTAIERDFPEPAELSRKTRDGEDYLEKVSGAWLRNGLFIVGVPAERLLPAAG